MNKIAVYSLTSLAGILLVFTINLKQDFGKDEVSKMSQPIIVDGKIAPQLSDLFEGRDEGPHQEFNDENSCLKCHKQEIEIPGLGTVPKIPHEFRKDCISCHLLPS
ncbi:MAG: hypothetical protein ACE5D0_05755 [Fidelibacterota bacterium]